MAVPPGTPPSPQSRRVADVPPPPAARVDRSTRSQGPDMTARPAHRARRLAATLTALLTAATLASLAACSSDSSAAAAPSPAASSEAAAAPAEAGELRLGYFANLTHALPLIGVA